MSWTYRVAIWWHRKRTGHHTYMRRVSPPGFDPWARGVLVTCDCDKVWAQ